MPDDPKKRKRKSKGRRASGTGALFWSESRGVWIGRLPAGRGLNGRPKYVERSHRDQSRVVEMLREIEPPTDKTTLAQFFQTRRSSWRIREDTANYYRSLFNSHIAPTIGAVAIPALTLSHIQQAADKWVEAGLKPNSVRTVLGVLRAILNDAIRAGLIRENPVAQVKRPPVPKPKAKVFTPEQMRAILEACKERPQWHIIGVVAATGCRIGEARALSIADYKDGCITINKSASVRTGKIGKTKTENSVRTIRLPAEAKPVIELAIGKRTAGLIFQRQGNKNLPLNYSGILTNMKKLMQKLELANRGIHQFRHTVATHLVARGVSLTDVAKYLGDTVQTIIANYCHPTGLDVSAEISKLFSGS